MLPTSFLIHLGFEHLANSEHKIDISLQWLIRTPLWHKSEIFRVGLFSQRGMLGHFTIVISQYGIELREVFRLFNPMRVHISAAVRWLKSG